MNMEAEAVNSVMNQEIRLVIGVTEVLLKLAGKGAERIAAGIYAVYAEQGKTEGKMKLQNFLRDCDGSSSIISIPAEKLAEWVTACKAYGIRYTNIDVDVSDNLTDIMVMDSDMPRIKRILERYDIVPEITRMEMEEVPIPEKAPKPEVEKSDVNDTLSVLGDQEENGKQEWVGEVRILGEEGETISSHILNTDDELKTYVSQQEEMGEQLFVIYNGSDIPDYLRERNFDTVCYSEPQPSVDNAFADFFVNPEDRKTPSNGLLGNPDKEPVLVSGQPSKPLQTNETTDKQTPGKEHGLDTGDTALPSEDNSVMARLLAAKQKLSQNSAASQEHLKPQPAEPTK